MYDRACETNREIGSISLVGAIDREIDDDSSVLPDLALPQLYIIYAPYARLVIICMQNATRSHTVVTFAVLLAQNFKNVQKKRERKRTSPDNWAAIHREDNDKEFE